MIEKTADLYSRLPDSIPLADAEHALELLAEFKQETELTKRDRAKAAAVKQIALAEITKKYDFYEKLFAAVFAERRAVAQEFFRVIDQGIREKNNDLVLAGLSSLSGMVASSPLTHLGKDTLLK
ncbi:MAG: hypothetical protein FWG27_02335 [Treponema sp.]|nr:hypothetical protein [Treponema sp.]